MVKVGKSLGRESYPMSPKNIKVSGDLEVEASLAKWPHYGLRINLSFCGTGIDYSKEPFPDEKTAFREYRKLCKKLKSGEYKLVLGKDEIRLESK